MLDSFGSSRWDALQTNSNSTNSSKRLMCPACAAHSAVALFH